MTWSLRNLRTRWKPTIASTLGFLLIAGFLHGSTHATAQTNQTAKQSANKPGTLSAPRSSGSGSIHASSISLPQPRPGWSYPQRQTLTYEVDWRVFPAGTAVLHMESSGDSQRLTVTGDSLGAFNLLFRVNDRFQSTFSRKTGCSSGFAKQLLQGSRQVSSDQQFAGGQSRTTEDEKTLISHSHHAEQISIPPCVTDALAAILYAASQPLQTGQQFHLPVVYGDTLLDVTAHVEGRETIRTASTTYQTLRVQPTWSNAAVRNSGNIWVWYTDDDRHIPVQLRARLFWGTITFRLTGIEQK